MPSNPAAIAALQAALAYAEDWLAYRAFRLRVPGDTTEDGEITSIRGGGGMTMWPFDVPA